CPRRRIRAGFGMLFSKVIRLTARLIAVCALHGSVHAQDDPIKTWAAVPPRMGGLVLLIPGEVTSVTITSAEKKVLDISKWVRDLPFVKQYRLRPNFYRLGLPDERIRSVVVNVVEGTLTYVRLSPYRPNAGDIGLQLTGWSGPVSPDVA